MCSQLLTANCAASYPMSRQCCSTLLVMFPPTDAGPLCSRYAASTCMLGAVRGDVFTRRFVFQMRHVSAGIGLAYSSSSFLFFFAHHFKPVLTAFLPVGSSSLWHTEGFLYLYLRPPTHPSCGTCLRLFNASRARPSLPACVHTTSAFHYEKTLAAEKLTL